VTELTELTELFVLC